MADPRLPPIKFDKPFGAGMGRGTSKPRISGAATRSAAETSRFFADPTHGFGKSFKGMGGPYKAGRPAADVLKRGGKKKKRGSTKAPISKAAERSATETSRFFADPTHGFGKSFKGMGGPYKAGR